MYGRVDADVDKGQVFEQGHGLGWAVPACAHIATAGLVALFQPEQAVAVQKANGQSPSGHPHHLSYRLALIFNETKCGDGGDQVKAGIRKGQGAGIGPEVVQLRPLLLSGKLEPVRIDVQSGHKAQASSRQRAGEKARTTADIQQTLAEPDFKPLQQKLKLALSHPLAVAMVVPVVVGFCCSHLELFMKLKLVGLAICPFVQRSVITLRHKQVDFEIQYIDLNNPPEWFMALSPLGKVPLLILDDEKVLFESAVINEFIDDVTPPSIKPADAFLLAQNRAWIEFGSNCLIQQYQWMTATTEADFSNARTVIKGSLKHLEKCLGTGPWFNGANFSLVDTAFAPLFMRYRLFEHRQKILDAARFPKISAWADRLLALPEVQQSVVPDFAELYLDWLGGQTGFGPTLLTAN